MDRSGDEMDVVRVELADHDAQLVRKVVEKVLASSSGQVVDDLADRAIVEPRVLRQRSPDR